MEYKVQDGSGKVINNYYGFRTYTGENQYTAIVTLDGEQDLYDFDMDQPGGMENLRRKYVDEYGRSPERISILETRIEWAPPTDWE